MLFRSTLAASVALLLVASSVSADAATSANSELKPRDLEERTSAAKVITSCTKSGTFALTFDDGPVSLQSSVFLRLRRWCWMSLADGNRLLLLIVADLPGCSYSGITGMRFPALSLRLGGSQRSLLMVTSE